MFYTEEYKPELSQNKNLPKHIFPGYFHNKGLDFIHINKILRREEVTSELPNISENDETPSVRYNLGSKFVINYYILKMFLIT